jgi:PAS domain S-box-containing protein
MMKRIWILSFLPLLVGLLAISGWWAHINSLIEFDYPNVPLVFNSAACFVMAGLALLFATNQSRLAKETQIALGLLIILFGASTLIEDLFNINLHVDELCMKCWLPDLNPHHGRMSPNTAFSFLLTGMTLIFLRYTKNKIVAMCTEISIFLIFLVSVLGLVGYLLKMEFLYSWYSYTRMTLGSAICFISISAVFWELWRSDPASVELYQNRQDVKILLLASAVLLCVSLTVGLASVATNFKLILPVTAAAILIGVMAMRWQVMPLIRRTLYAEKELRQTNKRLFENEERYVLAFKGSQSGVWDWTVGSKYIYSSPYLKALLGYAEHEMPDTVAFYHKITHPEDLDKVLKLNELHLSKNVPFKIQYRLKTKNSNYRTFEVIGQAIQDEEGNPVRMVGSMRDVTEHIKIEKMRDEFVSMVRDELKSPVNTIREAIGLILNNTEEDLTLPSIKLLKIAQQNGERLEFLMNEILDVAKIESGDTRFRFYPMDIMQAVQKAIVSSQNYAEKGGVLLRLTQVSDVQVNVDQELLLQVLTNLISNAIKFSPQGGEVTISVTRRNDFVRVAVTDQGQGIPEKFQAQIFQEYVHVESAPAREGQGVLLGLKLSKAIIEKFGGAMSFLTTPSHGTTFYFDLPLSRQNNTSPPTNLHARSQ